MSDIEKSAQTQSNEPAEPSFRYNADLAQGIEEKWQKIWDDEGTFWAANVNGDLKDGKGRNAEGRPSYFAMDMFPYPSGKGLHVGHPLGYLATDVVSRYHRMKGENVLHAMGYAPSVCRLSNMQSRPASIRASPPSRTSPTCAASCIVWA